MPESVFISAPVENGRLFAGDCDVIVDMDIAPLLPSWKMVTHPLSAKVLTLRSKLNDSTGRMCVWRAGVRSCVIGRRVDADVFATCPNATATVLCDGPVMGRLSLGLLKWQVVPESRRAVLISLGGVLTFEVASLLANVFFM